MEEAHHLIADVRGWGHLQYLPNGAEVQDANGLLIAAAPDLLDALHTCLEALRGSAGPDEINNARENARAAITKATGETP